MACKSLDSLASLPCARSRKRRLSPGWCGHLKSIIYSYVVSLPKIWSTTSKFPPSTPAADGKAQAPPPKMHRKTNGGSEIRGYLFWGPDEKRQSYHLGDPKP